VKASFFQRGGYNAPQEIHSEWPISPARYDPEYGRRSLHHAIEQCELADHLGFDWVSFSEHHYLTTVAPNPALAAAAVATRMRRAKIAMIGHNLTLNNPIKVAEELAMLDTLSDGRLVVGFLRGTPNEFQVHTVNPAESRDLTKESMELILRAWTEPVPFSWEGRHFQYRTVAVWPRPVQQPYPRCYVLGGSKDSAEFAARRRLGVGMAYVPFPVLSQIVNYYREKCAEAGWLPTPDDILYRGAVCVAASEEAARQDAARCVLRNLNVTMRGGINEVVAGLDPARMNLANMGEFSMARFVGTPDMIVQQVQECKEQGGAGVIDFGFHAPGLTHNEVMSRMELFGKDVLPKIRDI
jgi:alkanesulfonate monooxygenase SsuD/methylene tetrahydromethanopterin reductase-like flavin-dependent oxidoreductase (luciferase family)